MAATDGNACPDEKCPRVLQSARKQPGAHFDEAVVSRLWRKAKFRFEPDFPVLVKSIQGASRRFAATVNEPNANGLHREISGLNMSAAERRYGCVACRLRHLSNTARTQLVDRASDLGATPAAGQRGGPIREGSSWRVPDPECMFDVVKRDEACELIVELTEIGARIEKGVRVPVLWAPEPTQAEPRNSAVERFAIDFSIAYQESTGRQPPQTLNAYTTPRSPVLTFLAECLKMILDVRHGVEGVAAGAYNVRNDNRVAQEWISIAREMRSFTCNEDLITDLSASVLSGKIQIITKKKGRPPRRVSQGIMLIYDRDGDVGIPTRRGDIQRLKLPDAEFLDRLLEAAEAISRRKLRARVKAERQQQKRQATAKRPARKRHIAAKSTTARLKRVSSQD